MSCEGQVHGSIQMGLGNALLEEMRYAEDGRLLNPSFHDYKLCGTLDMPEVNAEIVESYDPSAPYGGKESGEGPIQPTPPAIFNAVYDAIGYRCTEQPLTRKRFSTTSSLSVRTSNSNGLGKFIPERQIKSAALFYVYPGVFSL